MKSRRTSYFEAGTGLVLLSIGFIVLWWSRQLFWITIYPQPLEKSLIEIMPFIFWTIGAVLIVDAVRRDNKLMKREKKISA